VGADPVEEEAVLAGGWAPLALKVDPMGPNLMFEYTTCALALCASTVVGAPELGEHDPRLDLICAEYI
jgi:hypothetical protein